MPLPPPVAGPRPLDPRQVGVWRVGSGAIALLLVVVVAAGEVLVRVGGGRWPLRQVGSALLDAATVT